MVADGLSVDLMLPDLLAAHPQARSVFDRYGLKGCGGAHGPVETVGFFARTHGVDQDRLMREIREAIARPETVTAELTPSVADTIYRRFFMGGIILILTAGATWGAWLLWRIGFGGNFTSISIHDVNAHGHAQIFGWVGLFIMGFAYQAFPRIWHTELTWPRLAPVAFVSMVIGLIVRTIGMTMAGASFAIPMALAGGVLEIMAVLIFVTQIVATFRRGDAQLEPYVGFAVMALVSFVAMSFMSVWHTWNTMAATTREQLLWYVATYQAPLRDLQVHGLAMLMIFGVCIRMLPPLFGLPAVSNRRAWSALVVLTLAVIGEIVIFIAYRWTNDHALAALLMVPWLMLAAGTAMVALPWKLWRAMPEYDRSGKFVRAAYAWLAISLVMLLLLPVYQAVSHIAFSHAYYGAIRHAITVGFISLMIMGFAAKVVPTLNGIDTKKLTALWGPFVLVNLGCVLRVSLQTLTDWNPVFFKVVGISGALEVTGLAWWGFGLAAIMVRGRKTQEIINEVRPAPDRIEADQKVTDVLEWFPETMAVFEHFGFGMLKNPLLRRTVARGVTVRKASSMHGIDTDEFVAELNREVRLVQIGQGACGSCGGCVAHAEEEW